jgi:murein DD-endopeptidase MepM/ murein hydrolase activator NlpD
MDYHLYLGPLAEIVDAVKTVDSAVRGTIKGAAWVADKVDNEPEMTPVDPTYVAKANRIHDLLQEVINNPGDNPMADYIKTSLSNQWMYNADGSVISDSPTTDLPPSDAGDDDTPVDDIGAIFPLPGPISTNKVQVPEGFIEVTQYWSTAELMTFQLELALKARWSSIGNKALMDGLGMAKGFAESVGGLLDFAGGVLNPLAWGTSVATSGAGNIYNQYVIDGCCFPVMGWKGKISDQWGNPRDGGKRSHQGNDLFCEVGTPILAFWDGIVTRVTTPSTNSLGGHSVTIKSSKNPSFSAYNCHMQPIPASITVGTSVAAGQVIGYADNSGNAKGTSCHLHFGIRENGKAIPCEPYLRPVYAATEAARNGSPTTNVVLPRYNSPTSRNVPN